MGYTHCFWVREEKEKKKLAELISWTHKNEQIGVSFGWANHSLTYKALGHEESPLFPSRRFSSSCDGCDPVLLVMGLVNVKLFWHVCLKSLQWLCWNYRMEVRNKALVSVTFWKEQDLKRASFLSGIIQQDWEWRGSQYWSRGAAYENGREQLGRRDYGLLQATVLLTHTFLTLKCIPRPFTVHKGV